MLRRYGTEPPRRIRRFPTSGPLLRLQVEGRAVVAGVGVAFQADLGVDSANARTGEADHHAGIGDLIFVELAAGAMKRRSLAARWRLRCATEAEVLPAQ